MGRKKSLFGTHKKSFLSVLFKPAKRQNKRKPAKQPRVAPEPKTKGTNNGWRYRPAVQEMKPVALPVERPLEVPSGSFATHVYVYDGRPLRGTRKGSKFRLAVVPGYHTMTSVYTGNDWTSDVLVAYNGHLIGYIAEGRGMSEVRSLMARYPYVTLSAERCGTDSGGWPLVEVCLPQAWWISAALNKDLRGSEVEKIGVLDDSNDCLGPNHTVVTLYSDVWVADVRSGLCRLVLKQVPTPVGSSAQPHIQVLLDDVMCAEVTARHRCYRKLAPLLGPGTYECEHVVPEYDDGGSCHLLIIATRSDPKA